MKKRRIAKAAFLNPCLLLGSLVFFGGVLLALFAAANPQVLIDGRARNLDAHVNGDDEAAATAVDYAAVQYVPDTTPTPTPTCTSGPWVSAQAMPLDLYAAAAASDGTYSYHFGGYSFSQGNTLAVVNRFNPATNTWASMAPMPQAASNATAVYYPPTNKIYVFGGSDPATGTNYNITRIYDIASNTWTTGANMLDVHSFAAGGYIPATGRIYIISGYNSGVIASAQPNTWQYNPVTNTWTDLTASAPFPHPAGGFAYGVINNKLYIAGGRDANNMIINLTWAYDPVTNTYTQLAAEPGTFQNNVPGSAAASGLLWVFGGGNPFIGASAINNASRSNRLHVDLNKAASPWALVDGVEALTQPTTSSSGRYYNPATNTWTSSPNMNMGRSFPSGAAIGSNLLIAAGGYDGSTTVANAEAEIVCGVAPTPTATATASPTPTFTPTPTATPTPTPTPTPCSGRCAPTPRPRPTASVRPSPPPRLTPPPSPTGSPRPTPAPRP
jgi:N-acetylneuraminic acid mutarotase